MKHWLTILLTAALSFTPLINSAQAAPSKTEHSAKITVLYDAFSKDDKLTKDWGYGALIEFDGKRILFDTGNNGEVLKHNAAAKNIDLSKLDLVVLSHRHGDHMGGLSYLLSVNPDVKIYAPKEGFGVYGADLPSSFYPKDESLPPELRYYDGQPPETLHFGSAWPEANFVLINDTTEIADNIHLIAKVSDKKGTLELKELSLVLNTEHGAVVIVGCSHAGVENIVAEASKINSNIAWVGGGFHLIQGTTEIVNPVVTALRDTYQVKAIAPGHCTGEPTFTALQKAFGAKFLYAGLGAEFYIGEQIHALAAADVSGERGLDETDLRQLNRHLLASNDIEHINLAQGLQHHSRDHHGHTH